MKTRKTRLRPREKKLRTFEPEQMNELLEHGTFAIGFSGPGDARESYVDNAHYIEVEDAGQLPQMLRGIAATLEAERGGHEYEDAIIVIGRRRACEEEFLDA
jgi:hypothetical protein